MCGVQSLPAAVTARSLLAGMSGSCSHAPLSAMQCSYTAVCRRAKATTVVDACNSVDRFRLCLKC